MQKGGVKSPQNYQMLIINTLKREIMNLYKTVFEGCNTIEEIKKRYRELAKKFHPDLGGDTEAMQIINRLYQILLEKGYTAEGLSYTEKQEKAEIDERLMEVFIKIAGLKGLNCEVCGDWLWVSGDTRPFKDQLKSSGLLWAPKKSMWYWRPDEQKGRRRGSLDIDKIRDKYGSRSLSNRGGYAIV